MQDRPGSADWLLLAAGYQYFLGHHQTANELLDLSHTAGTSENNYAALGRIVTQDLDTQPTPTEIPVEPDALDVDAPDQVSADLEADSGELVLPPRAPEKSES